MLNSKNRVFNPDFLKRYLSNEKNTFADNSRVENTIFLMVKLSFSLKLVSGHFYGQSFIKTVRGPFACGKLRYGTFQNANNKGADQTARMRRLICACVVCKPRKTGFLTSRPK